MKIDKLCKNPEQIVALEKMVTKLMPQLKQYHLDLLCETAIPPYVSELDFVGFYRDCHLADKNLMASSIDLIYKQVNTNFARIGLNRGQFIEALIRIAKAKYLEVNITKSLHEALEMLVCEHIAKEWTTCRWHDLRVSRIWTVEVNDLLDANLEGLKKVYSMFRDLKAVNKKRWMDLKDADQFMQQMMPELKVNTKISRKCYFLSKMTCSDEQSKIEQYNRLQFVEFLEMLCRIAHEHFEDAYTRDWPYLEKLKTVL